MTACELNEKINELMLNNKEFAEKIGSAYTVEETKSLLNSYGIDAPLSILAESRDKAATYLKENGLITDDGELSDEMLDAVAGGKLGGWLTGIGAGAMGVAFASDACAAAFGVALVSNPVGWLAAGAGAVILGGFLLANK